MIVGYWATALTGDMSRSATATKAMNTSGRSEPDAPSARVVPMEKIRTTTMPAKISLMGLVRVEAPCARSTR